MVFENSEYLWLLLLLLPLGFFFKENKQSLEAYFDPDILKQMRHTDRTLSKRVRNILLVLALALGVVALARPIIHNGEVKVKSSSIDVMVGFDISHSMFAQDVYPNRFEFAKRKFDNFLEEMKETRIGVIGFSSQAFLISPLTKDIGSLKFLVKNMSFDNMSLKGTDIHSTLEVTENLLEKHKRKALLLFTDGGDKSDYSKEIEYAKEHGIVVFVYSIATEKGGVIKGEHGVLKDNKGDIVVVKRNENIKSLALESGGAYLNHSMQGEDIKALSDNIKSKFKSIESKEQTIRDTEELFMFPLLLAMLLFFVSFSSLPKGKKIKREKVRVKKRRGKEI
jgi:Ca-activated chloride channel family protein